jgi:hypothetical protein
MVFDPNRSWWDWLTGQPTLTAAGQAQIQSVADNAAKYYGADSVTAQVAQQMANQQKALVPLDTANILNFYDSQGGVLPWQIPSWLWWGAGALGALWVLK